MSYYFEEILKSSGVTLVADDELHILEQEQNCVMINIENSLKKHYEFPSNCEEFIKGLEKYSNNEENFKKLLQQTRYQMQTDTNTEDNDNPEYVFQYSLITLLLNIDCLEEKITSLLFMKAGEKALDENDTITYQLLLSPFQYRSSATPLKNFPHKLLEILYMSKYEGQVDILTMIPDIIHPEQHNDIAHSLATQFLGKKMELTGNIVDCLNCLCFSDDIREDIKNKILTFLESSFVIKFFPILLEFLLTDIKPEQLDTILQTVRSTLDSILNPPVSPDSQVITFYKFCQLIRQKRLIKNWLNLITRIKTFKEHKPVDIFILFLIHSIDPLSRKVVETTFKNRVKNRLFKTRLLTSLFGKIVVPNFLRDYHESMKTIASSLITEMGLVYDQYRAEFGRTLYKLLFLHEHSYFDIRCKILTGIISFAASPKSSDIILDLLMDLSKETEKMRIHILQLMSLLQIPKLNLSAFKKVCNILCSLIYSDETDTSLQNEMHLFIKKQLSSVQATAKRYGIIAGVCAVDYLSNCENNPEDDVGIDDTLITIGDIPMGRSKDAANLIMLINMSIEENPKEKCLLYDQLSTIVVSSHHKEKYFMAWLTDMISNDFQSLFVTENNPTIIKRIPLSIQYNLNNAEEIEVPVSINIGEISIKSDNVVPIIILSPLFRLLRLLHYRQNNGDLSSIDALLGCGIIMPKLDDEIVFDHAFDIEQTKLIADCLFHCINWFREIISAFCNQRRIHRHRAVARFQELINLEELLKSCLRTLPSHKLPPCYVDTAEKVDALKVFSTGKKKQKLSSDASTSTVNDTIDHADQENENNSLKRKKSKSGTKKIVPKEEVEVNFRDFDTDVIKFIKYPLQIDDFTEQNICTQTSAVNSPSFNLKQFNFLLKDFVAKLEIYTKSKKNGLSHLNAINVEDFLKDCSHWLIYVNKHCYTVVEKIGSLLEKTDGRHDLPEIFTDDAIQLKISFNYLLQIYTLIFGWSGFHHSSNDQLLKDCLKSWRIAGQSQTQMVSNKLLMNEFMARLFSYVDKCLNVNAAIMIVKIIRSLYDINNDADIKKKLNTICGKFLTIKWYDMYGNPDKGKAFLVNIDILIKEHLSEMNIKNICGLVSTIQTQVAKLNDKDQSLTLFASIDKSNFAVLYRGICNALVDAVKVGATGGLNNEDHLELWHLNAKTMLALIAILKLHENKLNAHTFFKKSLPIFKQFISHGMPLFEITVKAHTVLVEDIIKQTQQSLRFLHHLSCQSKYRQEKSLLPFISSFRQLYEDLVLRAKVIFVAIGRPDVFCMGQLKNKDLQGMEILTQSTNPSNSQVTSDNGSDSELPPEDDEEENYDTDDDRSVAPDRTSEIYY